MKPLRLGMALAAVILAASFTGQAWADPNVGEVLKFYQTPLNNGLADLPPQGYVPSGSQPAPFPGHDELSTAYQESSGSDTYTGTFMADDFADHVSTPIVHVMWWGSYMNNGYFGDGVQRFMIDFEQDVPANDPNNTLGFSHPGAVISSQQVSVLVQRPGFVPSGRFTEDFVPIGPGQANPDGNLYRYNAELAFPVPEQANQVMWIKIVALSDDQNLQWGWHDRDYGVMDPLASTSPLVVPGENNLNPSGTPIWHFQDDAVTGSITTTDFVNNTDFVNVQSGYTRTFYNPSSDGISTSKDLAFALYTIPEPSSLVLLTIGAVAIAVSHWRRSRRTTNV